MTTKGKLIVFEGLDGAGKTSASTYFSDYLTSYSIDAVSIHAPTNTPAGLLFARTLANHSASCPEELALLAMAERCANNKQILEHLNKGTTVICDRYSLSTLCYQNETFMKYPELLAFSEKISLVPDYTFYFHIDPDVAMSRITSRNGEPGPFDQLEKLTAISALYEKYYYLYGGGVVIVIDSNMGKKEVQEELQKYADEIFRLTH